MPFDIQNAATRVFESLQTELWIVVSNATDDLKGKCESPIELMILTGFEMWNRLYDLKSGRSAAKILEVGQSSAGLLDEAVFVISPQFQWNGYRIDFKIETAMLGYPIFVECDGHEFHERTKEQAERDRTKDRLIQQAGIPILRFTGREIHRDPMGIVTQIATFAQNRARDESAGE